MKRFACPFVAGVDEVGRGPLAGPVVAAAVVLPAKPLLRGLTDSKLIAPDRREVLAEKIRARAVAWAVGQASVAEIDAINILHASWLAMRRAVAALRPFPAAAWVDGNLHPRLVMPVRTIVGGDACIPAISAASILAKVARDEQMIALDAHYPGYGFARHKGYGTPSHRAALARLGASAIHRRSFAPVGQALADTVTTLD